jgi:hypothetical protein
MDDRYLPASGEDSSDEVDVEGMSEAELLAHMSYSGNTPDMRNQQELLATIASNLKPVVVTDHPPEQAVREASLASKRSWRPHSAGLYYVASNDITVSLGSEESPLDLDEARAAIKKLGVYTTMLDRIMFWYWNVRRRGPLKGENGSVPILFNEIFRILGTEKHKKAAHPGTESTTKYTDGYRAEHKNRILETIAILAAIQVEGPIIRDGVPTEIEVQGAYLRYSTVRRRYLGRKVAVGVVFSPGDWINSLDQLSYNALTRMDEAVFQLDPQNDQYAIRIYLCLSKWWRDQAKSGSFQTQFKISDLLVGSLIEVDEENLTRFAGRIEKAFQTLLEKNIIRQVQLLTPIDREKFRWGADWLKTTWDIQPPDDLFQAYIPSGPVVESLPPPKRKRRRRKQVD